MARLKMFVFAVFLTATTAVSAQIVQSFCSGPTSLQNQYLEDAWYIAYHFQMKSDSANMKKSLEISPNLKNQVLSAILGVYNADLPARDSVISMYDIHAFKHIDLRRFEIYVDTNFQWTKRLLQGQIKNTGNIYVDSLANLFGFSLDFVTYFPAWVTNYHALARIKTANYLNTDYLSQIMLSQGGVKFANPFTFGGDGNQIFYERADSFATLTFRRGWGDCPAGCIFRRDWLFRVYDDCRVEFVGSYGNQITATQQPIFAQHLRVSPNPARQQIWVESEYLIGNEASIRLADAIGNVVQQQNILLSGGRLQHVLSVSDLPNGIYFLTLTNENQSVTRKIMIQR